MTSILILKPIIDVLYEEMKEYKEKTDKRIRELENEVKLLRSQKCQEPVLKNVVIVDDIDDDSYEEEAMAHPTSSPASVLEQVEIKEEKEEKPSIQQEDIKTVEMIKGKDRKEYMKEYQRNYRKKQKNLVK
jgi:hypothetical protein